jgi:hypothetical protein
MEQTALYSAIEAQMPTKNSYQNTACFVVLKPLRCPSERNYNEPVSGTYSMSNYCGSTGDYCCYETYTAAHATESSYSRGAFQPNIVTTLAAISDGLSNTLLCSERCIGKPDTSIKGGIPEAVTAVFPDNSYNVCEQSGFNPSQCVVSLDATRKTYSVKCFGPNGSETGVIPMGRWFHGADIFTRTNTILPPNSASAASGTDSVRPMILPPSSFHTGGVNVVRCDGSGGFITDSVNAGTSTGSCKRSGASNFGIWGAFGSRDGDESTGL